MVETNAAIKSKSSAFAQEFENMSADPVSKSTFADPMFSIDQNIIVRHEKDPIETEQAVASIYNTTTEPSTVAAITNQLDQSCTIPSNDIQFFVLLYL
jgi:hypothetical protein